MLDEYLQENSQEDSQENNHNYRSLLFDSAISNLKFFENIQKEKQEYDMVITQVEEKLKEEKYVIRGNIFDKDNILHCLPNEPINCPVATCPNCHISDVRFRLSPEYIAKSSLREVKRNIFSPDILICKCCHMEFLFMQSNNEYNEYNGLNCSYVSKTFLKDILEIDISDDI